MLAVISAIKTEIGKLIDLAQAEPWGKDRWLRKETGLVIAAAGVGYLEAAIRLQNLLLEFPAVRRVVFCGSAGVYPGVERIKVGDLCWCRETILADGAAELNLSVYASILSREAIPSTLEAPDDLESAGVATALTLTLDDDLAATIARNTKQELENMELYGVASVCRRNSVSWNALLGITNITGKNGSRDWKKNYRRLAGQACEYLFQYINNVDQVAKA